MHGAMRHLVLLLLVCILAAAVCGCEARYTTWNTDDGFSISYGDKEALPNISLEYPTSFRQTMKSEEGEIYSGEHYLHWGGSNNHSVRLVRLVNDEACLAESYEDGAYSHLSITIHISDMYTEMIDEYYNELGTEFDTVSEWYAREFKMPLCDEELSIEQTTVSGVPVYSRKCSCIFRSSFEKAYRNRILKETLFEYDDVLIHIMMEALEEEAEEVEEYYDHLLETFQIVE